jgi:hypothetical protein
MGHDFGSSEIREFTDKMGCNLLGFWPFLVFPLRLCASARFILDSNDPALKIAPQEAQAAKNA